MSESFLHSSGAVPGSIPRRMPAGTGALIRGGYIVELAPGLFGYLPLGQAVIHNITAIIREEFRRVGGEEIHLPLLAPADLWARSGRDAAASSELASFFDISGERLVLSPSHEESCIALLSLARANAGQLPIFFYQFQSKFRDSADNPENLVNAREFVMADGFSFHISSVDLNNFFPRVYGAFTRIFGRLGLPVLVTEGSSDYAAGRTAYEFLVATQGGGQHVVSCTDCGYSADQDVAVGLHKNAPARLMHLEEVPHKLPGDPAAASRELGVPPARLARVQIFALSEGYAMTVIRGDQTLSKSKLARALGCDVLREAGAEEVAALGFEPGYASPLGGSVDAGRGAATDAGSGATAAGGLDAAPAGTSPGGNLRTVVDPLVADSSNLMIPAGRCAGWFSNSNFGRDYSSDIVADISRVDERYRCLHCGGQLELRTMEKVGQMIKMGSRTTAALGLTFEKGNRGKVPAHLGSYGIGVGRLLAILAELRTDHRSLCWPLSIAPYKVHMLCVGRGRTLQKLTAHVYSRIQDIALWDDRKKPVLEKFRDADRLGIPVRIVVDQKSLVDGMVMFSHRFLCPPMRLPFHQIAGKIQELEEYEADRPAPARREVRRQDRLFGERMYT